MRGALGVVLAICLATVLAGCEPYGLTTECRVDPVGIDCSCPRLSWKLPDGIMRQTAYELELDGAAQGKVECAETLYRPWTGGELATGSRHVWRVRVWDENGRVTGWSESARFTMGVMRADDWRAKWIGPNAMTRPDVDFLDARWMTSTTGVLRLSLDLDRVPETKEIVFLSRSRYNLFVNGRQSRGSYEGHAWTSRFAKFHDLADDGLEVGRNVVEFKNRRAGEPLAVIAVLRERGASVSAVRFENATALGGVRDMDWCRDPVLRDEVASPAFERRFCVTKDVRAATLFITGLGFYEASLNGKRVGDKMLDPSPTDYRKRVLYSTYLLDGELKKGENVLRVLVGHGFYDVRLKSVWDNDMAWWRDFPRMIAQLEIDYADGTRETIVSDESWRQVKSPVGWDDIREGEVVGGGHVREPDFPAEGFPVAVVPAPKGMLAAENHPPTRIVRENAPRRMKPVAGRPGAWMVEFPENIAGWVRLRVRGLSSNDVVTIRYDERADADLKPAVPDAYYRQRGIDTLGRQGRVEGPVPRAIDYHFKSTQSANVCATNRAFQTDRFVSAGAAVETYEPRFTYNGFQYVLLEGLKTPPTAEDIVQCVVSTDFPEIGTFASSDPILDRLVAAAARTYRANFTVGIPTDCPHREKNGWTGDASVASDFAQFRFENTSAYEKWLQDVCDAQNEEGALPGIIPSPGWGYAWGNGPAWDSALYVVARNLYRYRDDRRIVDLTYPTMVRHLAYTETKADAEGLVRHGLDDWIPPSRRYVPTVEFTASCFFKQANEVAAEFASMLGRDAESRCYAERARQIRQALRRKYMKADGTFANGGQTAQSAALMFGLVNPEERETVAARLVDAVHRRDDHLETGVIGCKTLFRALAETGHADLALKVVLQKDSPSPAAWMHQGGDNFWEDWGEGASRNHIMFGDIAAWAYEYLAGIRQAPGTRGFRQVVFAPPADLALDHAAASVDTPYGVYSVSWRKTQEGGLDCRFRVPAGGSALVRFPDREDRRLDPGDHRYLLPPRASR